MACLQQQHVNRAGWHEGPYHNFNINLCQNQKTEANSWLFSFSRPTEKYRNWLFVRAGCMLSRIIHIVLGPGSILVWFLFTPHHCKLNIFGIWSACVKISPWDQILDGHFRSYMDLIRIRESCFFWAFLKSQVTSQCVLLVESGVGKKDLFLFF